MKTTNNTMPAAAIKEASLDIIEASKYFYSKGWMQGTSGNLSTRASNKENALIQFLITASGQDKGSLTTEDILLVEKKDDEYGFTSSVPNPKLQPSAETLLHASIYENTNARAVFHVHTANSTLLSKLALKNTEVLTFSNLEMIKGLGFKTHDTTITIPVIENSQDMKYIAKIASNHINENIPGLLLAGHGIYAWGETPQETRRHLETFEFLFEYRIKELSIK